MVHTGQCLCGQVRFTIDAEPQGARMCWCRDCQRIASGSATVNVLFPEEAVRYQGEMTTLRLVADSGNTVERGFCPKCGAQMYSKTLKPAGLPMRIRAGTLDDPELMAPTAIIWVSSAPSWASLDPKLPHYPKALPRPRNHQPFGGPSRSRGTLANISRTFGRALICSIQRTRCGVSFLLTSSAKPASMPLAMAKLQMSASE